MFQIKFLIITKKVKKIDFDIFNSLIEEIAITVIMTIIAFFLGRAKSILNQLRIRRLKRFFGKSAKNSDRINLIVPVLHPLEDLKDGTYCDRYKKPFDEELKTFPGPEDVMATADIKAASNITSLLEPLSSKAIEPIQDEDSLDYWSDRCLICIGSPLSNLKAKQLMEDLNQSSVSWIMAPEDLYNQRIRLENGNEFISTREKDYGLILKIENKYSEDDFAFIIGGIAHFGTIGAARFLRKNWKKLDNESDGNPFICVIQVDTRSMERIQVVHFEKFEKRGISWN
jgi:hypothetical protein